MVLSVQLLFVGAKAAGLIDSLFAIRVYDREYSANQGSG